jgi:transcriptional regulator with XRE-family HTH domain
MATLEAALGQLVESLELNLGLSISELAQALGVNTRSVERWRTGETHPQHDARQRLASLEGLAGRLRQTFSTPEAGRAWLRDPSRYLGGLTPADALRVGRIDRVEAALEALDSGVFV